MKHTDARMAALIAYFEQLQPGDIAHLGQLYTEHAYFQDPFNEVTGLGEIQRVFGHMFETLASPRFVVLDAIRQGSQGFISWDLLFRLKGQTQQRRIHGSSHLRFAPDGRVSYHRDYWDAAAQVYEQLPLLGSVLRFIKKRLRA
ncbi:nuclear transport factor 2 family protein [Paucibacter soli]|uniref:nuclear transport factor 2 family protein n=1 Tax=Paucibacter soli TaxID=3133433 RepID=UPI00309D5E13